MILRRPPPAQPQVDIETTLRCFWHVRHVWRWRGCLAWIVTIRIAGRAPVEIIGKHL